MKVEPIGTEKFECSDEFIIIRLVQAFFEILYQLKLKEINLTHHLIFVIGWKAGRFHLRELL